MADYIGPFLASIGTAWDKMGSTGQAIMLGLGAFMIFLALIYDKK